MQAAPSPFPFDVLVVSSLVVLVFWAGSRHTDFIRRTVHVERGAISVLSLTRLHSRSPLAITYFVKLWDFPFDLIFTQLIRTSIMVMVVDVTVELESNISEIFPITLPKKVKALKDAIRDFYCLTGGGLMKNVSGTDLFEVITDEDEQLSNGFEYKFVRGKSGISYPSLHSQ